MVVVVFFEYHGKFFLHLKCCCVNQIVASIHDTHAEGLTQGPKGMSFGNAAKNSKQVLINKKEGKAVLKQKKSVTGI